MDQVMMVTQSLDIHKETGYLITEPMNALELKIHKARKYNK